MTSSTLSVDMALTDRILLQLDEAPWHGLRLAAGFVVIPLWRLMMGPDSTQSSLVGFFLAVLVATRVLPMVIRRVMPFSADVREVWAARREWGKKHDSYQWQKLFAMGTGVVLYMVVSRDYRPEVALLAIGCLLPGVAGVMAWRRLRGKKS